jgi:hypothetical protein
MCSCSCMACGDTIGGMPGSMLNHVSCPPCLLLLTSACCALLVCPAGDPARYISHLPVHQDGSCNGLQHYAALGRDLTGGFAVNLCPADKPQASQAASMLGRHSPSIPGVSATDWLAMGAVALFTASPAVCRCYRLLNHSSLPSLPSPVCAAAAGCVQRDQQPGEAAGGGGCSRRHPRGRGARQVHPGWVGRWQWCGAPCSGGCQQ